jgi:DNA topoisomerase-1
VPNVGGVFVPKNPLFEAKHPRDRSGRDRGQFIDVPGVMAGLGATFDHERGVWNVPADRAEDLKQMGRDTGFKMMSVPKGMRPLRSRGALASTTVPETGEPDPKIAQDSELEKKLAIPPAWTDVMVSDDLSAEVLAVGRDEKGRKQTVRNKAIQAQRKADSFARIRGLDQKMGGVDYRLSQEAHDDDTAAAMMVVRKMGLRPGSTKDTKADQQAYGASTLQRRHVRIEGDTVHLEFDSKKNEHTVLEHEDAELASVLRVRLAGKAGDDALFPKTNDRKMNRWVDDTVGEEFAVKDFRTHLATSTAAALIADMPEPMTDKELRRMQLKVADEVAAILGNTRSVTLQSYIDPVVWPTVSDGDADMAMPNLDEIAADEIPGETGRKLLKDAFDAGYVEGEDLAGGVSSDMVKKVTLSDGTTAVLKRPKPEQVRREIIAGIAANSLGFDTVHTIDAGDGLILTEMVSGKPGGKGLPEADLMAHVEKPGGREMAVLDWVIRNRDRHGGNWIVTADGVVPIDHGLSYYGVEGADRDIPRGVFAKHWLGLTQKPTGWAAKGKTHDEALKVKGPKAKLQPKFSKQFLEEVRDSLELGRDEYSDSEWAGMDARLRLLEQAAPDTIPGELPFRGRVERPKNDVTPAPAPPIPGGFKADDAVVYARPGFPRRRGKVVGVGNPKPDGTPTVAVIYDDDPTKTRWQLDPKNLEKPNAKLDALEGKLVMAIDVKGKQQIGRLYGGGQYSVAGILVDETTIRPAVAADVFTTGHRVNVRKDGNLFEGTVESVEGNRATVRPDNTAKYGETVTASGDDLSLRQAPAPPPKAPPQTKPPKAAKSKPGARHSIPNGQYVSPIIEKAVGAADSALAEANVDLSRGFTRPDTKIGRHAKGSLGIFSPSTGRIDVDPEGESFGGNPIVTTLHELGHKLDWEANGDPGRYGSEARTEGAMGPDWDAHKDMRAGVAKYEAEGWTYVGRRGGTWATLRRGDEEVSLNWGGTPLLTQHGAGGKSEGLGDLQEGDLPGPPAKSFMSVAGETEAVKALQGHPKANQRFGKYVLRPREIFARAFAQYVASQSNDPEVRQAWLREQASDAAPYGTTPQEWARQDRWPQQWSDEDFAVLHVYFDGLMDQLGLRPKKPEETRIPLGRGPGPEA